MSVWGDILDRGAGETMRKEDEHRIWEFSDPLPKPITFVGNIDESTIPSIPTAGQLYFTNDEVTINGVTFPSGCMLLYDGNTWHNIGDYVHQSVDANIGYYQPVDVQESSII